MARRTPSKYVWSKLQFDETILTKHFTAKKTRSIKYVVIHHMTITGKGTGSANTACYNVWQSRKASAHYGVDGKHVRQFVWDRNVAWATGSNAGNANGLSIEHANSTSGPKWEIGSVTLATSAKLVARIHIAHKLGRPRDGVTIRKHKDFKATACPGPFFTSKDVWAGYIAAVLVEYDKATGKTPAPEVPAIGGTPKTRYRVKASHLNARSGPGMEYKVRAVREKGFEFNSSRQSGNWVQASTYWYHKDYLEVVSATPPKPVVVKPPAKVRYRVTTKGLNARTGPGMGYKVKAVRAKGFEFNSSKASGNWVRASKYWYHKDYLEVVPAKKPDKKPTVLTLGSFNIPLDSAKIPGGSSRVKIAAKQVRDSGAAIVAYQELDRGSTATAHKRAESMLSALGAGWALVKPSTAWNENYIAYRKADVTLVKALPDVILPSRAGGRHATRAEFKVGGKSITVHSTHFVSGSGNGAAREEQGMVLAQTLTGSGNGAAREEQGEVLAPTLTGTPFVLGDLNQKAVPAALAKVLKAAVKAAPASLLARFGTFATWGKSKVSTADSVFLDHILVPLGVYVREFTMVGVQQDGTLTQPRASDHLFIVATVEV